MTMATARQGSWKLNFPPDERLSASLNIDAKIDIEESAELMRDEEAIYKTHDYPSCSGWEKRKGDRSYGYGDGSRWLKPLGLAFALFSLVTILITSSTKLAYSSGRLDPLHLNTDLDEDSKTLEEILGIRLHPQDHVDRAPKTITHHWKVTSGIRSPDGVKKEVYLVNDQFPGPTIECRSGDRLIIHVTNSLKPGEPVSIHWHGLHVANRMDGAAGFTQCPIPSGKKFIYEFDVPERQSGTFWWHAHSGIQKGDGMYGGLVVHKPVSIENEMEMYGYTKEVLLLIGDWYHRSAGEILDWYMSSRGFGNEPVPDSLLINGAGRFICSMAVPARPVECEDISEEEMPGLLGANLLIPTRLRVVNVGSLAGFTIQASSGALAPFMVDGGFAIEGRVADSVGILYPGERMDIFLKMDKSSTPNPLRLHVSLDPENFRYPNPALKPNQSFPLINQAESPKSLPTEGDLRDIPSHFDLSTISSNSQSSSSSSHSFLPETADQTLVLYTRTEKLAKYANKPMGFINRTSWAPQSSPSLPLIALPRSSWDVNQLVPFISAPNNQDEEGTWVDLIINNIDEGSHPFHLHGHSFYVLASHRSEHGWGSYNPFSTDTTSNMKSNFNLVNPVRKDTVIVPRRGYVVVRFRANNPGVWMLHCHVLWHEGSGMVMGLQVSGNEEHAQIDIEAGRFCDSGR